MDSEYRFDVESQLDGDPGQGAGMRLRRPCEHVDDNHPEGHYDAHRMSKAGIFVSWCSGGEFLPEDASEKVWWCPIHRSIGTEKRCDGWELVSAFREPQASCRMETRLLLAFAADQVGEPTS